VTRRGLLVQALSGKDFLSNDSGNTHHSGTTVVEFRVLLTNFLGGFLFPVVDLSKPDTVVAIKLGGGPPGKLDKAHNNKDLGKSSRWDLEKSTDSAINISELQVAGGRKVSIESPLVVVDKGSKHGHHGNTSVLALDGSVSGEFLIIRNVSKGIEKTKRGSGSNLLFRNL